MDSIRILRQSWDELALIMNGSCGDLLAKRTNKYEKTAAEFAEFKENF